MISRSGPRREVLRFAATFLALVAVLRWLITVDPLQRVLQGPLCDLVAWLAAAVLDPFGAVELEGNRLAFDGFWVVVVEACNGVLPTTIYLAAILAFPASLRARLWGAAIGVPAIFLLNLFRVVSLLVLGAHWPAVFEQVHVYVWQTLIVALSMALWIFWAEHFVRPAARVGPGV